VYDFRVKAVGRILSIIKVRKKNFSPLRKTSGSWMLLDVFFLHASPLKPVPIKKAERLTLTAVIRPHSEPTYGGPRNLLRIVIPAKAGIHTSSFDIPCSVFDIHPLAPHPSVILSLCHRCLCPRCEVRRRRTQSKVLATAYNSFFCRENRAYFCDNSCNFEKKVSQFLFWRTLFLVAIDGKGH